MVVCRFLGRKKRIFGVHASACTYLLMYTLHSSSSILGCVCSMCLLKIPDEMAFLSLL